MLKKFLFSVTAFSIAFMEACSDDSASDSLAGGTIDPNSIAEASSSSCAPDELPIEMSSSNDIDTVAVSSSSVKIIVEESSSSSVKIIVEESSSSFVDSKEVSSSSIEDKDILPDPIPVSSSSESSDTINPNSPLVYCLGEVYELDSSDQKKDFGFTPSAQKYVENDWVKVTLIDVALEVPCAASSRELFLKMLGNGSQIQVKLESDTLYVADSRSDEKRNKRSTYGCVCAARIEFSLDKRYSGFDYTVFNRRDAFPVEDLTPVSEPPKQNKQEGGFIWKILTGIVAAPITAALSFALLACGDDSSSTAPEPVADGNGSAVEESSSSELPPDTTCCKVTLSSSSEEQSPSSVSSSSNFDVPLSSETCCIDLSSSSQGEKIVQRIDDIFGTCRDKKVDPMLDAALPPVTYLGYEDGDDSATVVVENVSMHCRSISGTVSIIRQPIVGNLHLSASGDTLYMIQYSLDTVSAEPDCICDSRLIFKVKADPAIINATVFVAVRDGDYGNRIVFLNRPRRIWN